MMGAGSVRMSSSGLTDRLLQLVEDMKAQSADVGYWALQQGGVKFFYTIGPTKSHERIGLGNPSTWPIPIVLSQDFFNGAVVDKVGWILMNAVYQINMTYNNNCTSCQANSTSAIASGAVTDCKCKSGYTGPDGGTCVACGSGKFKTSNGSAPCSPCDQGKYTTETGENSESRCLDCPSGTFNAVIGAAECTPCAAGKYSPATAAISHDTCVYCSANAYSPSGSGLLTNCTCNKGYTGPNGIACAACIAGTYKDVTGSSSCFLCSEGKYSTGTGGTFESTCSDCPAHTYSPRGSGQLANCTCDKGYTGPDGLECAACIAGTYKDVNGSTLCSLCGKGKYSTEAAEITEAKCSDCPVYTFSGAGSRHLTNCTCNEGYTGPIGAQCEACEAGGFKDVNGSAACTLCLGGKYSTTKAAISETTCESCPSSTYSPDGSGLLTNCTCNKGYTGPDGTACAVCTAGTYKNVTGSAACTLCPSGKYSTASAATSALTCSDCPARTLSPRGSGLLDNCTCKEGYTGEDGGNCTACPAGTYKDALGSAECSGCLSSASTSAAASDNLTDCKCNAGYTGDDGGNCTACPAGTYKDAAGSAFCKDCSSTASTFAMASKNANECKCNVGYTGDGEANCTACPAGSFKTTNGSATCTRCDPGHFSAVPAVSTNCTPCPRDTYSASNYSFCVACPENAQSRGMSFGPTACKCNEVVIYVCVCVCVYAHVYVNVYVSYITTLP